MRRAARALLPILALQLAALLPAEDKVLSIGDFESGIDGFNGSLVADGSDAKVGKSCGLLKNSKADGWVETGKPLPGLLYDFKELRFWAKSPTPHAIAVRLYDATGQAFQYRPAVNGPGWQQITLTNFSGAMEIWDGAGDKKWHPPAKQINFILEGGNAEMRLDGIEAVLADKPVAELAGQAELLAKAKTVVLGDFENGNDGFSDIAIESSGAKVGKACGKLVNADKWVETGKALDLGGKDLLALSFWVKSKDAGSIAVRLTDSSGQSFQHRPSFNANGEWQEIKLADFAPGMESWGGANDKKWHQTAKQITFIVEAKSSTVYLDGITALVAP